MSQDGSKTYNLYLDPRKQLQMQLVTEETELINAPRSITIMAAHIDDLNMFQCIVVNKKLDTASL
jgi:hypothetical protein